MLIRTIALALLKVKIGLTSVIYRLARARCFAKPEERAPAAVVRGNGFEVGTAAGTANRGKCALSRPTSARALSRLPGYQRAIRKDPIFRGSLH